MTDETKQKLKYWLIGIFTGGAVAAPVTAFVCKNIYEKKIEEASEQAETRGMNAMAEYAVQQQAISEDKPLTEEDYAEKDPRDIDTSIDDEEEMLNEEAHQRYLDMIDKYNGNREIQPHIIDVEKYENEMYMQKSCVNWYEEDDVFEEDLEVKHDPYFLFGVTSGHQLFDDTSGREDPDTVYVRNESKLTDFEITRIHGSYAQMVGGESGLGETD